MIQWPVQLHNYRRWTLNIKEIINEHSSQDKIIVMYMYCTMLAVCSVYLFHRHYSVYPDPFLWTHGLSPFCLFPSSLQTERTKVGDK